MSSIRFGFHVFIQLLLGRESARNSLDARLFRLYMGILDARAVVN